MPLTCGGDPPLPQLFTAPTYHTRFPPVSPPQPLSLRAQFGVDDDDDVDTETTRVRLGRVNFGASPDKTEHAGPIPPIPPPSKGRAGIPPFQDSTGGRAAMAAASNGGTKRAAPSTRADSAAGAVAELVHMERLAAERAFSSMDQNSGRVSTRRLGELLTLLGRTSAGLGWNGDAMESARLAGLLDAPSFSREDFVRWWVLRVEGIFWGLG